MIHQGGSLVVEPNAWHVEGSEFLFQHQKFISRMVFKIHTLNQNVLNFGLLQKKKQGRNLLSTKPSLNPKSTPSLSEQSEQVERFQHPLGRRYSVTHFGKCFK